MNRPRTEILRRALGYPYDIRAHSFTLRQGRVEVFDAGTTAGRHPIIAVGSNRAPHQLARKFRDTPETTLPVQSGRLWQHDVVYSAHLSTYGAVPATLRHVPATVVQVAVTWLTDEQLARMHETELPNGNYDFVQMNRIRLETEQGETLTTAYAYCSSRGHLAAISGQALALSEIDASGRCLRALTQRQALDHVRTAIAPDRDLDDFVFNTVMNGVERRRYIEILQRSSTDAAHWPHTKIVAPGYEKS